MKHLTRIIQAALVASIATGFTSCASIYDRAETYTPQKLEFVPTQSDSGLGLSAMVVAAAESRSRGPYRLAVFAVGEPQKHLRMDVTSLRISTPDGKSWNIPQEWLETGVLFMATREGEKTQATYIVPTLLALDFEHYDVATVSAGVTVHRADGTREARACAFTCDREKKNTLQSWFLPLEIVRSARMNDVPLEHMDVGANKPGWKTP